MEPPPAPAARGAMALAIDGWIDEIDGADVRPGTQHAAYLEALSEGAGTAEARFAGCFASACWEADGTLRLARSPWRAPPLHYAITPHGPAAATILRVLFSLGMPRALERNRLAHALYFDGAYEGANDWYEGIAQVPSGCIVRIDPAGSVSTERWYDPHAIARHPSVDPQDWVAEGRDLLDRAARHAAAHAARPAVALSAGLDSPLTTDALVRQGARPLALTLAPDPAWMGDADPATFTEEAGAAAALADRLGLEHQVIRMEAWDEGLREFYRASDVATPFIANLPAQIALARAAGARQCDVLFDATIGNDTISASGHWAYAEYLRRGRWAELHRALDARPDDPRSLARKLAALALAPLLPRRLGNAIRRRFTRAPPFYAGASFLRHSVALDLGLPHRLHRHGTGDPPAVHSRRQFVDFAWAACDAGQGDIDTALEQMTGVARRDVLAYRPLIEFALSLPSQAFLQRGTDRWLARELGRGILPDEQRSNPATGAHHVDRFLRLGRARGELLQWAQRLDDHPLLGELVDTGRLVHALREWPTDEPPRGVRRFALTHGIPNVVALGRFVAHVEGRNDL